ncbi:MAG: L-histidine N(alpha)-methyltransferase [Bacteroidales bacterium]|nr:L-histidine N(alpha)-methyltransferase [Bacteroidales bacterium]
MKESVYHTDTAEWRHAVHTGNITIRNFLQAENESKVLTEIVGGLFAEQKSISSRFFYDKTGSRLFEEITTLPEYYPTRTEKSILSRVASDIAANHESPDIVELGSGDCSKICILMDAFHERKLEKINYYPVDVSETAILKSAEELVNSYPGLRVHGILADFMKHLEALPGDGNSLICFFGSTLGNLENEQALEFIRHMKRSMKRGDSFLLGLDMVKDVKTLELAYNDRHGVTGAFNKNILTAVNRIAGTNFDPVNFKHLAFFNSEKSRIEMHLEAVKDQTIESPHFSEALVIKQGETIHTENSRKFTHEDIRELANVSGLSIRGIYTDQREWFSLVHLVCNG